MIGIPSMEIETELGQLGLKNQKGQRIDEPAQHALRHEAHLISQTQISPEDLQHPCHQTGHHQVLNPHTWPACLTGCHKPCHQERRGTRG